MLLNNAIIKILTNAGPLSMRIFKKEVFNTKYRGKWSDQTIY